MFRYSYIYIAMHIIIKSGLRIWCNIKWSVNYSHLESKVNCLASQCHDRAENSVSEAHTKLAMNCGYSDCFMTLLPPLNLCFLFILAPRITGFQTGNETNCSLGHHTRCLIKPQHMHRRVTVVVLCVCVSICYHANYYVPHLYVENTV